jgi:hypothetical protein
LRVRGGRKGRGRIDPALGDIGEGLREVDRIMVDSVHVCRCVQAFRDEMACYVCAAGTCFAVERSVYWRRDAWLLLGRRGGSLVLSGDGTQHLKMHS